MGVSEPRAKPMRLRGYDYTQEGAYFITVVAHQRRCLFGDVCNGTLQLNHAGRIVAQAWMDLKRYSAWLSLDAFVVMPNHVHGILVFGEHTQAQAYSARFQHPVRGSLGRIISQWKAACTRRIQRLHHPPAGPVWQDRFYDHIIRSEAEWQRITAYILANPQAWQDDLENPNRPSCSAPPQPPGLP